MNNNSSRFGKYIEMNFSPEGTVQGGKPQRNTSIIDKFQKMEFIRNDNDCVFIVNQGMGHMYTV